MNFSVIGGGSWGTAIACITARANGDTLIYTPEAKVADDINQNHRNSKYFDKTNIDSNIRATCHLDDVFNSEIIVIAVPSFAFCEVISKIKNRVNNSTLIIATKGLSQDPIELFSTKIEREVTDKYAFLSGPNFAREVIEDKFTSIIISSKNKKLAKEISKILKSKNLDTDYSCDIITTQISAIVKNIIAIKSGILKAQNHGNNARAWLISNALKEIAIISEMLGGDIANITLPSVVGDLVLTSYSDISRNTKFGYEFCMNDFSQKFLDQYPVLVEGVFSAKLFKKFLKPYKLNIPTISSILELIDNK